MTDDDAFKVGDKVQIPSGRPGVIKELDIGGFSGKPMALLDMNPFYIGFGPNHETWAYVEDLRHR